MKTQIKGEAKQFNSYKDRIKKDLLQKIDIE